MSQTSRFDPHDFTKWIYQGLKETLLYRIRQSLNPERLIEQLQEKIPSQNQSLHLILRRAFETNGFRFERLNQGDAEFFLIRKTIRKVEKGHPTRRLVMVPGFGDTPASWIPLYGLLGRELGLQYDELILIDFPGYMGFLSHRSLIPSMKLILSLVKTVCEANPPSTLIGHSLGGWLAAKVSQELQKPIDHLVLIAPSGLIPEATERQKFADFIVGNQHRHLDEILNLVMHDPGNLKYLVNEEFKEFFGRPEVKKFVESVRQEDFIDSGQPFRARKVTTIWGESDRFVPAQWTRYWVEHYGTYLDAYLMKKTGHIPQLEHPIALAQILKQALFSAQPGMNEAQGWIRIQSRQEEYDPQPLKWTASLNLPGPGSEHA